MVTDIEANSTAAALGFHKKDIVLAVNGRQVTDAKMLGELMRQPRSVWRVTINRDGQQISSIFGG